MNKSCFGYFFLVLMMLVSTRVNADLFEGKFHAMVGNERYQMTIHTSTASGYEGVINVDGDPSMQIDARRFGDKIAGRLNSISGSQGFTADAGTGTLVFQLEDGGTIVFRRVNTQ